MQPKSRSIPLRAVCIVLLALLSNVLNAVVPPSAPAAVTTPAATNLVDVWVVLQGPSLADDQFPETPIATPSASPQIRRAQLEQQGELFRSQLPPGATLIDRFYKCVNAALVRIPIPQREQLLQIPGVIRIASPTQYSRLTDSSVPFVLAPALWSALPTGFTGKNIRIGIIDSGIDYHHAHFGGSGRPSDFTRNDPTVVELGTFPTPKVAGGRDFVGENYDAGDPFNNTPRPDPDPLDSALNGHGTHVAGIAAGFGVTADGKTYKDNYANAASQSWRIGPGVAPDARLFALKVFGRQGTTQSDRIVAAIEWAIDPNDDSVLNDRLDIVNISLGRSFGQTNPDDVEQIAVKKAASAGIAVVLAAGNDGDTHFAINQPAVQPDTITVGSSIDNLTTSDEFEILSPPALAGRIRHIEGLFTRPLADLPPITAPVVLADPASGCGALRNAASLRGRIALIDRGDCFFVEKIRKVQAAGALAAIVANNVDDDRTTMVANEDTSDIVIPGVLISKSDGARIKAALGSTVTATLDARLVRSFPELADRISDSSSRGPTLPDHRLKPDLVAPGEGIRSARASSGQSAIAQTGTSMAAPHVAGALALLRQARPDWPLLDLKSVLLNSAQVLQQPPPNSSQPYPESLQGAGRLHLANALACDLLLRSESDGAAVSLNLGALEFTNTTVLTRKIRILNRAETSRTVSLSFSNTLGFEGISFRLVSNSSPIIVGPRSTARVDLEIEIDPARLRPTTPAPFRPPLSKRPRLSLWEASGQIWAHGGAIPSHLPWYGVVRPALIATASDREFGTATGQNVRAALSTRASPRSFEPLVSAFVLGHTNSGVDRGDLRSAADLIGVGAASHWPASISSARLYFGIAVAGPWATPLPIHTLLSIEVDLDRNGRPDFVLLNASSANLDAVSPDFFAVPAQQDDALRTAIWNESLETLEDGGPLNALDPDRFDTAPFGNSVAVLSAPATAIGLSTALAKFRYRARVESAQESETSPWIEFDAASPPFFPTAFGINNTPFFFDGGPVSVLLPSNSRPAAASPSTLPVLLLHHHAQRSRKMEIVGLNLRTDSVDGDSLPDTWEAEFLGGLAARPDADADQDGFTNEQEFRAGTQPLDPLSRFVSHWAILPDQPLVLSWPSAPGRAYAIDRADHPQGPFAEWIRNLPATPPLNRFPSGPNPATLIPPGFYRVRIL